MAQNTSAFTIEGLLNSTEIDLSNETTISSQIGCFKKDSNGSDIIDLDQKTMLRERDLVIHRTVTQLMSFSALFLNLLLLWLVRNRSKRLKAMTPLFVGTATLDIFLSISNILETPYPINAYGYIFGFNNNSFFTVPSFTFYQILGSLNGGLVVSGWNCVPIGFFYRLYVVKCGHRPSRRWLLFFASVTLLICCLCIASASNVYFFTGEELRQNAMKILRHMGYEVNVYSIVGNSDPLTLTIYRKYTGLYGTIIGLVLIAGVQIYLQYSLMSQAKNMSALTRKMHAELNFVMIALGLCPLLTNLFPAITAPFFLQNCQPMHLFHIFRAFILLLPPLLTPLTTILFVQPYRSFVVDFSKRIVGIKKKESGGSQVIFLTSKTMGSSSAMK